MCYYFKCDFDHDFQCNANFFFCEKQECPNKKVTFLEDLNNWQDQGLVVI